MKLSISEVITLDMGSFFVADFHRMLKWLFGGVVSFLVTVC